MFDIGGGELLLILIFVLITFGPKKLPELAQSLGRGLREFKRAQREFTEQINSAIEMEQRKSARSGTISRPENVIPRQMTTSRPEIGDGMLEENNTIHSPGAHQTIEPPPDNDAQLGMFPEKKSDPDVR